MNWHTRITGPGLALLLVAVAIGVRHALAAELGDRFPFLTLFPAVMFAAWFAGRGAGVLVTLVGALAANYFFLLPSASAHLVQPQDRLGVLLFSAIGVMLAWVVGSAREQIKKTVDEREMLALTFASIGDAVLVTDARGCVMRMNGQAAALTGWRPDQAQGKPVAEVLNIIDAASRQGVATPMVTAIATREALFEADDCLLIARDGSERQVEVSARALTGDSSQNVGCVLVLRDITPRRVLEGRIAEQLAAARQLASIVEFSDDAIIRKSLDGTIEAWNAAAERLFGYQAHEIVGQPVTRLIPAERMAEEADIIAKVRAGRRVDTFTTVRVHKDGREVNVALTISPIKRDDGTIIGASKIARDISAELKAQAALRRSEQELSEFFDNAAIGIHWIGPDGVILRANKAVLDMLGYQQVDYVGHAATEFLTDTHIMPSMLASLSRGEAAVEFKTGMRRQDGDIKEVIISASARHENHRITHVRCFVRDITAQRVAEEISRISEATAHERAEELHAVLRATPVPVLIAHDRACTIVTGNPAARRFFDDPSAQARASADDDSDVWLDPRHRLPTAIEAALLLPVTRSGQPLQSLDLRLPMEGGGERHVIGSAAPLLTSRGTVRGCVATLMDITRLKAVENALRETDSRKNQFLATLAHELRNPLAPLSNSLALLALANGDPNVTRQALATMTRQIEHLVRLIDDLVDVGRITRDRLELRRERVELQTIVQHAVESCQVYLDRYGLELSVDLPDEPLYLDADPIRIAQVFGNLLINACRYSRPGGHIWLTAQRDGAAVRVTVKDTGIGIPADMLERIFEMFFQVDRPSEHSAGGLGIGLSLVKRLVEMHGGSVSAHSEGEGRGSEFVVMLPVRAGNPAAPVAHPVRTSLDARHVRRTLVVDDNQDSAESLATLLRLSGQIVETAYDGAQAVELAAAQRPDLILLDLGLPKLNGYEVCRAIRSQAWSAATVIIALSGWGQDEDRRRSRDAGFDAHFAKPLNLPELAEFIARHARVKAAADPPPAAVADSC